jgi:HEAT repeat protein
MAEIMLAEEDLPEFDQMMDALEKILVALINMADLHSATKVLQGLKRFEEMMRKSSDGPDHLNGKKAERTKRAVDKAGEEENVRRISRVINEKEITELTFTKEYLLGLNWNSIPPMVRMLGDLSQFSARKMVSEVLAKKAKDHLELLGEGISDQRWYVVRNVVSVLGAIGSEKGVQFLKLIAKHQDLRIRKEIVSALFKIPGEKSGLLLVAFLDDADKGIRILACRGLARRKEKEALPELMRILKHDQFKDKSPEEKKSILETFAIIADEEAVAFLVKMISRRNWLQRDKHNETRIFAVGALSLIDDPGVEEAINQLSRKRNKAIRQACLHALRRIEARRMREGEETKII